MAKVTAAVLLVGDELLAGDVVDANGPFLAERLTEHGYRVEEIGILPDETRRIEAAVRQAVFRCRLVVVCGGLGPTSDDRTTEAVAQAVGRKRVLDAGQWERLRQIFLVLRGAEPPPGNEKQAMFPEGADVLPNEMGTAPGYGLKTGDRLLAVLPGPPRENRPMVDKALLPWLERSLPGRDRLAVQTFRVFGLAESEVGDRLRPLEASYGDLVFGYRFSFPEILVKVRGEADRSRRLEEAGAEVRRVLDPHVYGTGERKLPAVLGAELLRRGLRVVAAESCTGGLVAKLLTDTEGSSAWMDRAFVTYSNASKSQLLGVPDALLEAHGAVSEPAARAMLQGALERSQADLGVAVTGIAGPTGGSAEKPVGTVWTAWGDRGEIHSAVHAFHWDRDYNRLISAWAALRHLLVHLGRRDL